MEKKQVVKRGGNREDFSPAKIRKTIERAAAGFELDLQPLEEKMADFAKDGVSTAEIAKYLTLSALSLTTVTDPDWKNAAGRLKLFELYKQMSETRQTGKNYNNLYDYPQFLKFAEENGIYSKRISEVYSEEEIKLAAGFIEPKFDLVYDYAGINLLIKRYLCEYGDRIVELPQDMFLSIALLIEQNADKDIRLGLVKDTYEKLANRKISLATPLLMNLRRPNGNLSSCFITVMDDSRDSIFYVIDQISAISKFGGGVGCNLSRVRCKGARIKGIKNSSGGVIPWIRIINDTAVAVNQQGKRKGAVTVSLDMWHLDIEDFLELRTENGDQRMKAYDIFPQVVIPDLFMKKVESNRMNPNKHDGVIVGTNLCTESHSNVRPTQFEKKRLEGGRIVSEAHDGLVHVCNLVSINLANVDSDEELESICNTSVRILDNAIDFTEVPILEGSLHNRRYRTIGVGAMGLADHLAKRNIPYNASADYVDDLFEKFALYNIQASINLAKEKGTFGAYEGSDWSKGLILGRRQLMYANSKYARRWNQVFADLAKYGIRNSQITAIAPNTSSSLIQGCTASVLPIYSKFFVENHSKGSVPNCPPFIKDKFWFYQENRNLSQQLIIEVMSRINKWIDTGISIELMYNLNRNIKARDIYDTIMDAWKKGIKTLYYTRTIQKDGSSAEKEECVSCAG